MSPTWHQRNVFFISNTNLSPPQSRLPALKGAETLHKGVPGTGGGATQQLHTSWVQHTRGLYDTLFDLKHYNDKLENKNAAAFLIGLEHK